MEVIPEGSLARSLANDQTVTRVYLESLTTADLIRMADNCGIDIPPDLDRIFIIEELLEITSENERADVSDAGMYTASTVAEVSPGEAATPGETSVKNSHSDESVPLPKQYNITFIKVMIRDPLWAFVFWEIKAADKEQFEKASDFDGYYLKVCPVRSNGEPTDKVINKLAEPLRVNETDGVFSVSVKPEDTAWYLGFGSAVENEKPQRDPRQYKVELCVNRRGEETVLAVSNPFRLPELHELPAGAKVAGAWGNPLVRLSGYENFHILHNNERSLRLKRGASAGSYE